jgi:murein DD-endopeptidase MepM/ murein hydrolase activator NlpD
MSTASEGLPSGTPAMHLPLPGPVCPTSSFGSRRSNHIHAGVDFSTGGRTGVPVLAVDTCHVWRISVKSGGYGRALYAVLPGGEVAVYGHLSRYAAPIETAVVAEQNRQGAYEVELYPGPNAFRFLPGDTVAYSGETGAGPPHLHFELRSGTADFDNLSPLPDRLSLCDSVPPAIKRLRIVPLDDESSLNGKFEGLTLTPQLAQPALTLTGAFGVSVSAIDIALCDRVISPTRYQVSIDGEPVWKIDLVRFPFAKGHFVRFLYELAGTTYYVRLFDPYGLDLEGFAYYRPRNLRFFEGLAPGQHTLRVVAGDPWGGEDEFALPFTYGHLPVFDTCRLDDSTMGTAFSVHAADKGCTLTACYRIAGAAWQEVAATKQGDSWTGLVTSLPSGRAGVEVMMRLMDPSGVARECVLGTAGTGEGTRIETVIHPGFVEIYARTPTAPRSLPVARVVQGERREICVLQPVAKDGFRGCYRPEGAEGAIDIRAMFEFNRTSVERNTALPVEQLKRGSAVTFAGDKFKVTLVSGKGKNVETLVAVTEGLGSAYDGFAGCAGRLDFEPEDVFFESGVGIEISANAPGIGPRHGLYSLGWAGVALLAPFDSTGRCRASINTLDPLAVLEDTEAPALSFLGNPTIKRDGTLVFAGSTADRGSGIDTRRIRAYIDGEPAVAGYDPDSGRIEVRSTKPLPYGRHSLRLEAEDRIGNLARREVERELLR